MHRPALNVRGLIRSVTRTRASTAVRAETIVAQPPCSRPRSAASSGLTSQKISGCSSDRYRVVRTHARRRCGARSAGSSSGRTGTSLPRAARTRCPARELLARGIRAHRVERVVERRLVRLVVRRQRPVDEPAGREEPATAVGLHDERVIAPDRVRAAGVVGRLVVRPLRPSKSGTSSPVHLPCSSSHQTYRLRSDHGLPSGSADARL